MIIMATPHEDGALIRPEEYIGPQRFGQYREAVSGSGARFVPALKANVITIDRLPALRAALAERGFELAVADQLQRVLDEAAQEATARADEGAQRLTEAEGRLKRGASLYPYQRDGIRWLAVRSAALLGDEMGLGKTIEVLMTLPADARVLVVAPSAVAANWISETIAWRPDLRPGKIRSRSAWRWPAPSELLTVTYGSLPDGDQELTPPPAGMIVVADEAHLLKGTPGRTRRVRRWQIVRDAAHMGSGRVWLLTGTPMLNRPQELWRVIEAAREGLAKQTFGSKARFEEMLPRGGRGADSAWIMALQNVMLRRDKVAVLPDLPRKRYQVESTPISDPETLASCDELVAVLADAGKGVEALLEQGSLPSKVREVIFTMLSKVRAALATAKTPRTLELAKEYEADGLPVVVFSAHLAPLEALAKRPGWAMITGSVSADNRGEIVHRFQAGELKGVACSYAAGGVGITLARASHVLCVDQPWTPALLQQAGDRCCRIGQEADSVHIRVLTANHAVDQRVAELLIEKTKLIEATIEAAAVEEVRPDDHLAKQATALAQMAASTVKVVEKAKAAEAKRAEDLAVIRAGESDRRAGRFAIGAVPDNGTKRGPRNPVEVHAAWAMVELAALDPDHASEVNNAGFSRHDTDFGGDLAKVLIRWGRLSPKQWAAIVRMARKYRRQVGLPPTECPQALTCGL